MKEENKKWYAGLGIALTNDIFDLFERDKNSLSSDILDLMTTSMLLPLLKGKKASLTVIEFLPGGGYLPTHTIALLWSWRDEKKERLEKKVS